MTKRSPDRREQNRLKKIESEKERRRYLAADYVRQGLSLRAAAEKVGRSTFFVSCWRDMLLDCRVRKKRIGGVVLTIREYSWKKGYRALLVSRRPGPKPGRCPKA
jgi:hypothetical protein